MTTTPPCPMEAHAHHLDCPAVIISPDIIHYDGVPIAVCWNQQITARLVELVNRHGIVNIPDSLTTWPPPTGPMQTIAGSEQSL